MVALNKDKIKVEDGFVKVNKFLKNIGIILCLGLFLVGCTPKDNSSSNVSLDFLVTPEQLRIHSDTQLKELNEV